MYSGNSLIDFFKFFWYPIGMTLLTLFVWGMGIAQYQYQWKDNGDGTITSRKYGTYPKEVEFKQGMNIMPGQTAKMEITIEKETV